MSKSRLSVALTGGIGSGKSAVSAIFEELGVKIIDTDLIARELVEPGQPAYDKVCQHFGKIILQANHHLDRKKLREIIFHNPDERLWLESLLHPLIRQAAQQASENTHAPYIICAIPLLNEQNRYSFIDRVLVIDVCPNTQIKRVMARDQTDESIVKKILASQLDRETRLALADDVISNDGSLKTLRVRVERLHQEYLQLADKKH